MKTGVVRIASSIAVACAVLSPIYARCGASPKPPVAEIMIVGVAHLAAKADLHNSTWGQDSLGPAMQTQIIEVIARIRRFHPTKVMIEADPTNPAFVQRYRSYLDGKYALSSNENDQFGYRLAALEHLPTIFPIDTHTDFPFDYDAVKAAAKKYHQEALLDAANAHMAPLIATSNALEKQNRLLDVLQYMNTQGALDENAAWYLYVNAIGNASSNYSGANLTSLWYARNLHILANIMQPVRQGDRVVVFLGQGHAAELDPLLLRLPNVQFIDPETYLSRS